MMAIPSQFPSCGYQDLMDNGCGGFDHLCFNVHQQKQLQQQCDLKQLQNQLQRDSNLCFDNSLLVSSSTLKSINDNNNNVAYFQTMDASYDQKQRQEIDHLIRLQNEKLRLLLQEQKRQQIGGLMKRLESKAGPLLRQKDEEIAQAAKKTMDLEDFLKKLEMENQGWQRLAQEKEAMVISLNNTIEQLRDKASCCYNNNSGGKAEDAESCCDRKEEEKAMERNRQLDDDIREDEMVKGKKMMECKGCNSRNSCVLFLPCRHLCSCKSCEAFLDSCPLCQTPKKASIEALIV